MNFSLFKSRGSRRVASPRGLITAACLIISPVSVAANNMWDVLKGEGNALDIMGLERVADGLQLYGAEYVEELAELPPDLGGEPELSLVVRKKLYVIRVGRDEQILWRHVYASLPDTQEIFSTNTAHNSHMCIVFGEHRPHQDLLNPVLIQIDAQGKILWVRRDLVESKITTKDGHRVLEQIANLDTLRVIATPENGCMLAFVTRVVTRENEMFYLHLIQHQHDGTERWHHKSPTKLFGRMFLINDEDAKHYVIVQTNQSRDAAIQAMMQGVPFNPQTAIAGISRSGEILYRIDSPESLTSIWVNGVANARGDKILLAGKTRSAWAGYLDRDGKVEQRFDTLPGGFNAVATSQTGGYIFVRGDAIELTDSELQPESSAYIRDAVVRQYINQYLTARLTDDTVVEHIVPWNDDEYLLYYKLGSRLVKVKVPRVSARGSGP